MYFGQSDEKQKLRHIHTLSQNLRNRGKCDTPNTYKCKYQTAHISWLGKATSIKVVGFMGSET